MRFFRLITAGAAALAMCGLLAGPAAALDGDCLWNGLPAATRNSMLDDYKTGGFEALDNVSYSDEDIAGIVKCGLTAENSAKAGELIGGVLLEKGSELILIEKFGVRLGALAAAFEALPAAGRAAMRTESLSPDEDPGMDAFEPHLETVAGGLKLSEDDAKKQVMIYLLGRSFREAREAE